MYDTELCRDRLHALKTLGVQLAVDDFGSGYSTLDYLRRFEFDIVKIDQSFTVDVPRSAPAARMASAVCGFLHLLGYTTTVEGIEREEQADFFAGLGCARAQGFAFSPPVDAEAMADLLRAHRLAAQPYGTSEATRSCRRPAQSRRASSPF
jgi:EAL domain-containing protein (putative c-di-GMP-specific phosphodiesterase class I)